MKPIFADQRTVVMMTRPDGQTEQVTGRERTILLDSIAKRHRAGEIPDSMVCGDSYALQRRIAGRGYSFALTRNAPPPPITDRSQTSSEPASIRVFRGPSQAQMRPVFGAEREGLLRYLSNKTTLMSDWREFSYVVPGVETITYVRTAGD